jgi:drug/metabolite transporter (DMT)-like permease
MGRVHVWLRVLRRLPNNARGALWMLAAVSVFSTMDAAIKLLGQTLDSFQIALFRCVFGGLAILPFALRGGFGALRTKRWGGHLGRALIGYTAMVLGFYAVTHMPLADATALSFTRPLFMIVLAVLFLGEQVRWRRWSATTVGFLGVMVMARPGEADLDIATLSAIGATLFVAGVGVMLKRLSATERPETIIFYFTVISSALALGPALYVWRTPTLVEFIGLSAIGALGSLGQYFTIRSYRIAEATAVDPVDYTRLLIATAFGFLLFRELPDVWTLVGALIIIASTLYITRREARLGRTVTKGVATPAAPSQPLAASDAPDRVRRAP